MVVLAAGDAAVGAGAGFLIGLWPVLLVGGILFVGALVILEIFYEGSQEVHEGTGENAIDIFEDTAFRGEVPLHIGNEKYGWTHINNNHGGMWNDPELLDPTASPDVKDQHIRDRIRDTVENPTGIFDRSDPGDHRTLYVKKFNNRFDGCSIFVVIVGQDGVITAWKKLDADATDEISGFPDVIRSPGGRIKC